MKRSFIAIVTILLLVAPAAKAASFSIDTDQASYGLGESIVVSVSVALEAGEEFPGFTAMVVQVGWDDTVASGPSNSAQDPVLAGLAGLSTPSCAQSGDLCTVISQVNATFSTVEVTEAVLVQGELILEAVAVGAVGLSIITFDDRGITDPSVVSVGSNFQNAQVVPEPGTAALLALGLAGLGLARRR